MATPTRIETLPNKPAKGLDYDLGDGTYARVVYKVLSNDGQTMRIEYQAWQVDVTGQFVTYAPDMVPSRTPSQTTEVHLSGCMGPQPTCTLRAGWVYLPANPNLGLDLTSWAATATSSGAGKPTAPGNEGDTYWDTTAQIMWKWHPGAIEGPLRDKATELQTIIANSADLTDFSL